MSPLYDDLSHLYRRGHARLVSGLLSDEKFVLDQPMTQAAVLIAVTDKKEPTIILTKRREDMRSHPGQVAFPGGKLDIGEDPIGAALREANEELSIEPGVVKVIGPTDAYKTGTGYNITPVLAVVPSDLQIKPNPSEVESWFEAPLRLMLSRESWETREVFWRGSVRKYLEFNYQGYRVWGVTAAIIANLAKRIKPEELPNAG